MKNEVILYKRKQPFIRLLGLLLAIISFFVIVIFIVDCLYYNKKIELAVFLFPVMLIIFGIYVYLFTGYTKDILISYNEKGFNVKNMDFVEWKQLKVWTLTTKEKIYYDPFVLNRDYELRKKMPFPLDLFIDIFPKLRKTTLKLELIDKRTVFFSEDETKDMFKFLKFLYKNFKNKQKGKFRLL